ncbi:MAG: hypothetical protein ACYCUG_07970 [Acidimicrobiales bacterium]
MIVVDASAAVSALLNAGPARLSSLVSRCRAKPMSTSSSAFSRSFSQTSTGTITP